MSRSDRGVRPRKRPREAGEGWPSGSKLPPSHPSVTFGASSPRRGAFYCCANLKAPLCKGGSAVGGGGLWPDGSRSICPQDYNPSVCAAAQPALRALAPLSLRDISPHCGESPFTQGGLFVSRRGGFHIRPRRFAAAQDPAQFPSSPQSHTSLKIFGAKSTTFFFAVQERFLQKVLYFVRECGTIFLIYKIHRTFKKL